MNASTLQPFKSNCMIPRIEFDLEIAAVQSLDVNSVEPKHHATKLLVDEYLIEQYQPV
jgi:hypothetical protein